MVTVGLMKQKVYKNKDTTWRSIVRLYRRVIIISFHLQHTHLYCLKVQLN